MKRPSRPLVLGLIVAAAAGGASLPILAGAVEPPIRLPDLRSTAPGDPGPPEVYSNPAVDVNGWLIVRFDGFVTNVGKGPLDISGNPQVPGGVVQRAPDAIDSFVPVGTPDVRYEESDDHNHFHLKRVVEYSMWNADRTAMVAPANKVGFCLYDIDDLEAPPGGRGRTAFYDYDVTRFCQAGEPGATQLRMGISAGWRDVYGRWLEFQYVNLSDVAPGTYWLAARADPDAVIAESDEENPIAFNDAAPVVVPGFVAGPVQVGFDVGAPVTVALSAARVGSEAEAPTANRRFRITDAPAHGTLDRPVGALFEPDSVTYTPDPGFRGVDSFRYVAVNTFAAAALSGAGVQPSFPLHPPEATALMVRNGGAVGISGAPARLFTGTSAQLTATVFGAGPAVVWSVDGVPGGDATVGTITPEGLYVAPATPPAAGAVTISATSVDAPDITGSQRIEIVAPPVEVPLPAPPPVKELSAASARLGTPTVALRGEAKRIVVVGVTVRRAGLLTIRARDGRRITRTCRVRVRARQRATCRLRLTPRMRVKRTTVVTLLKADSGGHTIRKTRLRNR